MSETVSLPALGESVTEGTVTRWLKNVGDRVEVDEPLLEVSTDKVDTEVPSPISGVVEEILVQEDETVDVGTVLARIGDGSGASSSAPAAAPAPAQPAAAPEPEESEPEAPVPAPAPASPAPVPAAPVAATPAPAAPPAPIQATPPVVTAHPTPVTAAPATPPAASVAAPAAPESSPRAAHAGQYVTPIVRKLANEHGVDLDSVTGSGVGGRIRKEDVLQAAASAPATVRGTRQQMSRLRQVTAENAVLSLQSSAQATSVTEIDVTALADFRASVDAAFEAHHGIPLEILPFVLHATAAALRQHPDIEAAVDGDTIVYPDDSVLCLTVDTEKGILTPAIRDAATLSIPDLAKEIAEVRARVASNSLHPDELAGGTFTVTDSGSRGTLFDTPVVFLPQVAALGVGTVTKRPAVLTRDGVDAIAIRSTVYVSLSYDQRLIDSAAAGRFLATLAEELSVVPADTAGF